MLNFDKEIEELRDKVNDLDILLKLLIATGIRSNAVQNNKNDYDYELEQVSLIFNKLQAKINESKRSEKNEDN